MHRYQSRSWTALVSAVVLICGPAAVAQQPAPAASGAPAAPPAPPSWAQGRSSAQDKSPLAPHNAPLTAKNAEEIPVDKIKVPDGFEVSLWASGMPNARSMTLGDKGTVFVGSRLVGRVYAVVERDGKREVKAIAQGLHRPNGVAFKDGALYVAELSRILRYDDIENRLDSPPEPKVVYADLPKDEPHGWKFIAFGPDGMLYVPVGAPCNICEPPDTHAQIRRIKPDGAGAEVVARGVRNTRRLRLASADARALVHRQRPRLAHQHAARRRAEPRHQDRPEFRLPRLPRRQHPRSRIRQGQELRGHEPPAALLGPHAAALGMRFYTGDMFPAEYKDRIIVARHGSWNRD